MGSGNERWRGAARWSVGVALLLGLWAPRARAGRVVVFPFPGDRHGRVRTELVKAVRRVRSLKVIPFSAYRTMAARQGLRGARAVTPSGVAQVASSLRLDVEVSGAVGKTFFVNILGPDGLELWSKELQLHRGRLGRRNARRLAKAVEVAARQMARVHAASSTRASAHPERSPKGGVEGSPPARPEPAEKVASAHPERSPKGGVEGSPPVRPEPVERVASAHPERSPKGGVEGSPPVRPEPVEGVASAHPERSPKGGVEGPPPPSTRKDPPIFTLRLLGTTTTRSYCARPGVATCAAYDSLGSPPSGVTIDYGKGAVPYQGVDAEVALLPFAHGGPLVRGLGILGGYHRGFVLTSIQVSAGAGQTPATEVNSIDWGFDLEATWRLFFSHGPSWGYGGVRVGYRQRVFETDPSVRELLPGSGRAGPVLGLDFDYPLLRYLAVEASVEWLPTLTPLVSQTLYFGSEGGGSGFGLRAGLRGDLFGPLGYFLQFRWSRVSETFSGQGKLWSAGGAAQETFLRAVWGMAIHL